MITVEHLSKRYAGTLAVDDLSFTVQPGVVTGFLGPNGAGKSTTMRLMLDLDRGGGRVAFDGRRYRDVRHPMCEIGSLLEAKPFHPTRRARDHLRMLAAANRLPRTRVDEVLEVFGLTTVARKRPKTYSLGMGQRLGLAAAVLGDPHTLILDEPSNGLDPQGISWLRQYLRTFAAQGRTVLVSSHLLAEMAQMADHLVVIGRGRLLSDEPTAAFVAHSSHTTVVVRTPDPARLADALVRQGATVTPDAGSGGLSVTGIAQEAIGELAHAEGVVLHELATRVATLEEAFLEATAGSQEFASREFSQQPLVPGDRPQP